MKSVLVLSVWQREQKNAWQVPKLKTRQAFWETTSSSLDAKT